MLEFTFLTCLTAEHGSEGSFSDRDGRTTRPYRSSTPRHVAMTLCADDDGPVRKTWDGTSIWPPVSKLEYWGSKATRTTSLMAVPDVPPQHLQLELLKGLLV